IVPGACVSGLAVSNGPVKRTSSIECACADAPAGTTVIINNSAVALVLDLIMCSCVRHRFGGKTGSLVTARYRCAKRARRHVLMPKLSLHLRHCSLLIQRQC